VLVAQLKFLQKSQYITRIQIYKILIFNEYFIIKNPFSENGGHFKVVQQPQTVRRNFHFIWFNYGLKKVKMTSFLIRLLSAPEIGVGR